MTETLKDFVARLRSRHNARGFPCWQYSMSSDDAGRLIGIAEDRLFDEEGTADKAKES